MAASYLAGLQQAFDMGSRGKTIKEEKMVVNKRILGRVYIRSDWEGNGSVVLRGVGRRLAVDFLAISKLLLIISSITQAQVAGMCLQQT